MVRKVWKDCVGNPRNPKTNRCKTARKWGQATNPITQRYVSKDYYIAKNLWFDEEKGLRFDPIEVDFDDENQPQRRKIAVSVKPENMEVKPEKTEVNPENMEVKPEKMEVDGQAQGQAQGQPQGQAQGKAQSQAQGQAQSQAQGQAPMEVVETEDKRGEKRRPDNGHGPEPERDNGDGPDTKRAGFTVESGPDIDMAVESATLTKFPIVGLSSLEVLRAIHGAAKEFNVQGVLDQNLITPQCKTEEAYEQANQPACGIQNIEVVVGAFSPDIVKRSREKFLFRRHGTTLTVWDIIMIIETHEKIDVFFLFDEVCWRVSAAASPQGLNVRKPIIRSLGDRFGKEEDVNTLNKFFKGWVHFEVYEYEKEKKIDVSFQAASSDQLHDLSTTVALFTLVKARQMVERHGLVRSRELMIICAIGCLSVYQYKDDIGNQFFGMVENIWTLSTLSPEGKSKAEYVMGQILLYQANNGENIKKFETMFHELVFTEEMGQNPTLIGQHDFSQDMVESWTKIRYLLDIQQERQAPEDILLWTKIVAFTSSHFIWLLTKDLNLGSKPYDTLAFGDPNLTINEKLVKTLLKEITDFSPAQIGVIDSVSEGASNNDLYIFDSLFNNI